MSIFMFFNQNKFLQAHSGSIDTHPFHEVLGKKGITISPKNLLAANKQVEDYVKFYFDCAHINDIIQEYGHKHDGTIVKNGLKCNYKINIKDNTGVYTLEPGEDTAKLIYGVIVSFIPTSTKSSCKLQMGIKIQGYPCKDVKVDKIKKW